MKPFLNELISPTQSTVRLIIDNVLVAFEVNHFINHNSRKLNYRALKLDVGKEYDRIEWTFFAFLPFLILSSGMVYILSLSILVVGLRQDDPLSLYLFIFCVKVFFKRLELVVDRLGPIRGYPYCSFSSCHFKFMLCWWYFYIWSGDIRQG